MQKIAMINKKTIILVLIISFFSCTNNSEDDLIEKNDTINIITYNTNVKNIIDNNCLNCHGNTNPNAGLSLTNYSQVKQAVLNNGLIDRISRPIGDPQLMPQTGKLPQQTIDIIVKWNTDGLLE